jgi:hypothetical protein
VDAPVVASFAPGDSLSDARAAECQFALGDGQFTDANVASTRRSAPGEQPVTCVFSVEVTGSGGSWVTVYVTVQVSS